MANAKHLKILKSGVWHWNEWRTKNKNVIPNVSRCVLSDRNLSCADLSHTNLDYTDLSGSNLTNTNLSVANLCGANLSCTKLADAILVNAVLTCADLRYADLHGANLFSANLSGAKLFGANLSGAKLFGANLFGAELIDANLEGADLRGVDLVGADLRGANLSGTELIDADLDRADLREANLSQADLSYANLSRANLKATDLSHANLTQASLVETILTDSNIIGAKIYGTSVWGIKKQGLIQKNLLITQKGESEITVDDLEIAQFIYLLLNNEKFRDVIETVTSKAILILGRFTNTRKKVLDAIRDELRNRNFLPILFDFEKPSTRDLTETISILAKLSRFVIADLTDAKSIPQELSHIIPFMPNLPVIPIILQSERQYGMFEHWRSYPWVLPVYEYENEGHLIATLSAGVIDPAEKKVQEIRSK